MVLTLFGVCDPKGLGMYVLVYMSYHATAGEGYYKLCTFKRWSPVRNVNRLNCILVRLSQWLLPKFV